MKIFGVSLMTILIVAVAYWAGKRNILGGVTSKVGAMV